MSDVAPTGFERIRLLVVDDDLAIRELLTDLLEAEGYTVSAAAHGVEALEVAARERPAAILMDLMMPVMSGAEATARLRADPVTAGIPVIAMSAGRNLAAIATTISADGFVAKPFDIDYFLDTVASATGAAGVAAESA